MFRKEKTNLQHDKIYPGYNYHDVYRLRLLTEPQKYNFLPNSFIIRVKDPENFIPYNMEKHFNEKVLIIAKKFLSNPNLSKIKKICVK